MSDQDAARLKRLREMLDEVQSFIGASGKSKAITNAQTKLDEAWLWARAHFE